MQLANAAARQAHVDARDLLRDLEIVLRHLARGGIRGLHWHLDAEWAYVTSGACRITTIDLQGRANVADVEEGGLWYFPAGLPHSLQGVGPDGCEFIICFDDGKASEFNTLLLSDWMAHTPPDALAMNFGVPAETFSKIPLHALYIFQGEMPGPIEVSRLEAQGSLGVPQLASTFRLADLPPVKKTRGGEVRIADSSNFEIAKTIAASHVTLHPGGMREMHWHPNADEWTYIIAGQGELTVFNTGPNVVKTSTRATSATSSAPTDTTSATPGRPISFIWRCSEAAASRMSR